MQYTPNFNLAKPDDIDDADIEMINQNADKIDTELQKINSELESLPDKASSAEALAGTDDEKFMTPKTTTAVRAKIEKDALSIADWIKIASFETAGSGQWTAPDLFGDGSPYVIGVMIIGAGGSGALRVTTNGSTQHGFASGGGSGFSGTFTMLVTPGQKINYVVGAKGAPATTTLSFVMFSGNNGGSSSFNGKAVLGGGGGNAGTNSNLVQGANGGQPSVNSYLRLDVPNPFGGVTFNYRDQWYSGFCDPNSCFNPFENLKILGAGGAASMDNYTTGVGFSGGKSLEDGKGGGNGVFTSSANVTPNNANAPGCGGGGVCIGGGSSGQPTSSGAGADGAIWIYARRAVS